MVKPASGAQNHTAPGERPANVVPLRPADVLISGELATRPRKAPDLAAEAAAFHELSTLLIDQSDRAVKRFLELAVTLCGAGSSGLSLLETGADGEQHFRWDAVAGPLELEAGRITALDFSPSGMCLAAGKTILVSRPIRAFSYFEGAGQPVMEGLIVPLYDTGAVPLGTIWVVHHDQARHFDAEDARVVEQLAIQLVLALKLRDERLRTGAVSVEVGPVEAQNGDLINADAFLRGVLVSSGDCIGVLDLDANLVFMSEGGLRLMEVADFNEIRRLPWANLWEGEGHHEALAAIEAAKAGGIGRFQGLAKTKADTPKWWDVQVTPILDANGQLKRLLAVSRDITDMRSAEAALREARGLSAPILESSRDFIVVLDLEAHTRFVSPGGIAAMEIADVDAILGLSWLRVWRGPDHEAARAAVAKARSGGIGHFEGFCPTHKGTPKWWDVVVSPLNGPDGRPECLVSVGRDITQRKLAETELKELQTIQHLATKVAGIGVWEFDPNTHVMAEDAVCKAVFGQPPEAIATFEANLAAIHPLDRPRVEAAIAAALDPGGTGEYGVEFRINGIEDGVERWADARGRALFEGDSVQTMIGVIQDITVRKQAENRQRLLTYELKHRMKNTLAMVQAIANQTLRTGDSLDDAKAALNARLGALGRAQDILTQTSWSQASLREVVFGALEPHGAETTRFQIEGPDLRLSPKCGLAMSLALHELATNASKYGALSNDAGRIRVNWAIDRQSPSSRFSFQWQESGGPAVTAPERTGFGSRMLERSLAGYFSGTAELVYEASGFAFTLACELDALIAE